MSQDKELEIQLQFLDEAQEYLSTLEAALLGLSNSGVNIDKINAALRAAHSIKGGAGMMGFQALSHLAHRLEDSFKVLKVQKNSIDIDAELESLLLAGVDGLRQVIDSERQRRSIDELWLDTQIMPILEQLHDRLGEPEAEDAHSILSPEEGQDVILLLFQTEVEGCLQRLEAVIADQDPCLREEVDILAQELGGLGEMLQLHAFSQLCQSVTVALAATPDRVQEIAQAALQEWRRSQALVLTGHFDALPTVIAGVEVPEAAGIAEWDQAIEESVTDAAALDWSTVEWVESSSAPLTDSTPATASSQPMPEATTALSSNAAAKAASDETIAVTANPSRLHEVQIPEPVNSSRESQENTVRIPVKYIDQLNDLFGELTIERNGLDLNLKRLRGLLRSLVHRMQILEQSNSQLRDAYDRASLQTEFKLPVLGWNLNSTLDSTALRSSEAAESTSAIVHRPELSRFDVLELDRYDDLHLLSQEVMETIVQLQEVASDIELGLDDTEQTARELNKTSRQLRTKLTQVRMRPLSDITDRFPRALRELSLQYDKPVEFKVQGEHTLIDRNILEALSDPLMHLLRNAFDHGIEDQQTRLAQGKPEQGLIEIRAIHRNNRTIITVRDDGGGIPLEKIRTRARQMGLDEVLLAAASDEELLSLIFEPGFSTNEQVTALSGRGVGMDVVRDRLRQIHGQVKVDTQAGVGTTFTLSVPFTLSVTRVLIAESNRMLLAFPIDAIEEMLVIQTDRIITTAGSEAFSWQGGMVQLVRLARWLEFNCPRQLESLDTPAAINVPTVLMLSQGSQLVGLEIERSWGEQEVAIRKVEGDLSLPPGFSNCTILGDGRVVPLVSVPDLLRWIATCERAHVDAASSAAPLSLKPATPLLADRQPTILIVDDSINVRRLLALTLEKAGYQVAQAKDGQDALDKLSAGLHVQAVICDIEMPRLDGYGFLARVKASPSLDQIPVAMLTSRSGDKHRQLAMSLGATAYFSKPYNEQSLLQTLEKIVDVATS